MDMHKADRHLAPPAQSHQEGESGGGKPSASVSKRLSRAVNRKGRGGGGGDQQRVLPTCSHQETGGGVGLAACAYRSVRRRGGGGGSTAHRGVNQVQQRALPAHNQKGTEEGTRGSDQPHVVGTCCWSDPRVPSSVPF